MANVCSRDSADPRRAASRLLRRAAIMTSKRVQKTKEELMHVLDEGVKGLRDELSKKLEGLSSPQLHPSASQSLQPGP